MSTALDFKAGDVFTVVYPFVRGAYSYMDFDGKHWNEMESATWKPGVAYRPCAPDDTEGYCHAEGHMELTVVDVHKPGKYPVRVFCTRQWITPDGKRFGKTNLRIMTVPAFKRRVQGWFAEPYIVDPEGE